MNIFSKNDIDVLYKVIASRRDMRHFSSETVDEKTMQRILSAAHQAPNVGLIQPWRFIRIFDQSIRQKIFNHVSLETSKTAENLKDRKDEFLQLKVQGINDADQIIVVCVKPNQKEEIFGRRTMPEMDFASTVCAIQNMWLTSRVEGIGMGWVSLFEPDKLRDILKIPSQAKPIAILCIGHVDKFYKQPMLVEKKWGTESPIEDFIYKNSWPKD